MGLNGDARGGKSFTQDAGDGQRVGPISMNADRTRFQVNTSPIRSRYFSIPHHAQYLSKGRFGVGEQGSRV